VSAFEPTPKVASGDAVSTATSIFALVDARTLVEALTEGNQAARAAFFDRHVGHVERILVRILGHDCELADLLHEVFARALGAIETLEDPDALKPWLSGVAVFTAREAIRRRARGRWLRFFAADDLPEVEAAVADEETREALRVTYGVIDRLGVDDRIAFALRFIDGLELTDIAAACHVSLNTIKRRLARAERRFVAYARREPALRGWLQGGTRWRRD
jgi:RNA polymerase sigma-70 factor (ECF subfamily)